MAGPLANHEVVLEGLDLNKSYRFELDLTGRVEGLKAAYAGVFKTDLTAPSSRVKKGRVPIRLRRPGNGLWPVSVGVPFPKGALGSEDEIRLVDKRGAEVGTSGAQSCAVGGWLGALGAAGFSGGRKA